MGAGAAGLATAIFTRERHPHRRVLLLDSARRPGAKILVSGGARCNVTNRVVSEQDYWGGSPGFIRRVLRALPVRDTVAFFEAAGVPLHEEAHGKLFPDSNRARDVLDALLSRAAATGVDLRAAHRVTAITVEEGGFLVATPEGVFRSRTVVLATGGQALPKSGSDGAGYTFARALGHTVVPTTPALAPLVLDPARDRYAHDDLRCPPRDGADALGGRGGGAAPAGLAAVDAFRHQRTGRARRLAAPAAGAARRTPGRADGRVRPGREFHGG